MQGAAHFLCSYLRNTLEPGVQSVAGHPQVRLVELVLLGPSLRGVAQPLLDDGMEPGQQEVEACPLVRLLAHAVGGHCAEGADQVGLHARWGFEGEDAGGAEEVDWHL